MTALHGALALNGGVKLAHVATVLNGGTPRADDVNWNGDLPFVTPPDLRGLDGDSIVETSRSLTELGASSGSTVAVSGLAVSCRAPIGYVGRLSRRSAFNQGCKAVVPSPAVDEKYLAYVLVAARPILEALGRGTTFMEISASDLGSLLVPATGREEQRRIADYLDRETATIDVVIEKQRGLIGLLNTRREGVLLEASGIDAPWPRMPIKRVLRKVFVRSDEPVGPVVTAFRDGQVIARNDRRSGGYTESEAHAGYQKVGVGDFVYHGLDGFAGAVGISESDGICSPVYHVCRAQRADVHLPFFAYQLRALGIAGFLEAFSWSVRQRSVDYRNWPAFSALEIACPPHEEQRRIARRIVSETAKIDALIAKAERFIELARERRAALITAAVTGQIEIPTED